MPNTKYYAAEDCKTKDGVHSIKKLKENSVWYAQCTICNERFALISETVLKQLKLDLEPRPLKRNLH